PGSGGPMSRPRAPGGHGRVRRRGLGGGARDAHHAPEGVGIRPAADPPADPRGRGRSRRGPDLPVFGSRLSPGGGLPSGGTGSAPRRPAPPLPPGPAAGRRGQRPDRRRRKKL